MRMMKRTRTPTPELVLIMDFDVTITKNDLAYELLDHFGGPDLRKIENEIREGKITLREGIKRELGNLEVSPKELVEFTKKHAILDNGAHEVFQWAQKEKIPTYIISDGIFQYIEVVLGHMLKLPLTESLSSEDWKVFVIANKFQWSEKFERRVSHVIFPNPPCEHGCANCKPYWVNRIKKEHHNSVFIFIGDGYTDRLVAPLVDVILARKGEFLEQFLKNKRINHITYKKLKETLEFIQINHINP